MSGNAQAQGLAGDSPAFFRPQKTVKADMPENDQGAQKGALRTHFAQLIKDKRLQEGLTQEELGALIGVNKMYISTVERGAASMTLDTLDKFLRWLEPDRNVTSSREHLANNIKAVRKDKYSQESLATVLEVPPLYISRIERMATATSLDQVEAMALKLGLDPFVLLK